MADERKEIFIETVEVLFAKNDFDVFIPQEAIDFFNDYKKGKSSARKEITEKGINIILGMRNMGNDWMTAKSIGEEIDMSGRSVSGSMKKLVTDGYVEKMAGNPASYRLTEKGQTCEFPVEE